MLCLQWKCCSCQFINKAPFVFCLQQAISSLSKYISYGPSGYISGRGGGGEEFSTNVYTGWLRPKVQPLPLLYTIFHEKGSPLVYLLSTNGTPFTYLVQNFASLLTAVMGSCCCKCTVFQESVIKIKRFLDFLEP